MNEPLTAEEQLLASKIAHMPDALSIATELMATTRALRADLATACAERDALQAFKTWVHSYLDAHGVPHHPPGTHGAEGCRIGDRLDWLLEARSRALVEAAEVLAECGACAERVARQIYRHGDTEKAREFCTRRDVFEEAAGLLRARAATPAGEEAGIMSATPDPETVWRDFWAPIVAPDGTLDVELVKRELCDFSVVIDHCTEIYSWASRGRISKPMTLPSEVIAVAEDCQNAEFREWLAEEKGIWEAGGDAEEGATPTSEQGEVAVDYSSMTARCRVAVPLAGGWVPVGERLPEAYLECLFWGPRYTHVQSGHYCPGRRMWLSGGSSFALSAITHWMPLPSPPPERAATEPALCGHVPARDPLGVPLYSCTQFAGHGGSHMDTDLGTEWGGDEIAAIGEASKETPR